MKVIFAGGGTGGHIYPAVALAREIMKRHPDSMVQFVGTSEGMEVRILAQEGIEVKTLRVMGLKRKNLKEKAQALLALPRALRDALAIVRSFQPDGVLGVGGYASGPIVLAARLLGRTTMLQEQNSVPGMTNRWLGRFVTRVYTAYSESHGYFPREKVFHVGNPVREGLGRADRADALAHFGLGPDKATVLVLGGSRGAHAINRIVSEMIRTGRCAGLPVQFVHQTGEADFQEVFDAYVFSGIQAAVKPYIEEMALAYAAADLAVSRAGAVALSELCVCGVPMLLVPFPFAADGHQMKNACAVAAAEAAEVLVQEDLTPQRLGERIQALLAQPERLAGMRQAALQHARPDAVEQIVDDLERILDLEEDKGSRNQGF